jgi:hypothetical protein
MQSGQLTARNPQADANAPQTQNCCTRTNTYHQSSSHHFFKHEIIQIPKAQLNRQKNRQKEHVSDVFLRSHRIQRDLQSTKQNENPQATTRTAAEIQQNA